MAYRVPAVRRVRPSRRSATRFRTSRESRRLAAMIAAAIRRLDTVTCVSPTRNRRVERKLPTPPGGAGSVPPKAVSCQQRASGPGEQLHGRERHCLHARPDRRLAVRGELRGVERGERRSSGPVSYTHLTLPTSDLV